VSVNINDAVLIFTVILDIALAGYLLIKDRRSATNVSFSIVIMCLALWGISFVFWSFVRDAFWVKFWIDMNFASIAVMAPVFLYFSLVFPKREYVTDRNTCAATFIPGALMGMLSFSPYIASDISLPYIEPPHGPLYIYFIGLLLCYMAVSFFIIIKKFFAAQEKEKLQVQYLIFGTLTAALISVFTNVLAVSEGITSVGPLMLNTIGPVSTVVMVSFITYAIGRYNLLGIEDFLSRLFYYLAFLSFVSVSVIALLTHSFRHILYYYTILANILLGLFIFVNAPRRKMNYIFLLFSLIVSVWAATVLMFQVTQQFFWGKMIYAVIAFIPAVFLSLVRVFPREVKHPKESGKIVVYLLAALFSILSISGLVMEGVVLQGKTIALSTGPYFSLFFLFFISSMGLALYELYVNYQRSKGISRMQVKYLFLGALLSAVVGVVTGLVMPTLGYPEFAYMSCLSTLILVAFLTYAIAKHRLMSIEAIIQKSVIYTILTVSILLIYVSSIFLSEYILREIFGYSDLAMTIFAAVVIAIIYQPFIKRLQETTDVIFFRGKYDYQKILKDTSKALSAMLKLEELVKLVVTTFINAMRITEVSFLLLDKERNRYRSIGVRLEKDQSYYKKLEISDTSPVIKWLHEKQMILVRDELEAEYSESDSDKQQQMEEIIQELGRLEFAIWVPIMSKDELIAVMCLGYKLSEDMYTDEDIELLYTLANQLAVALENSIMYSTISKQYEELKVTKDKLIQADKLAALGNMAAGMAHEIKNPLSSMKVFSQLLHERYEDPEFRAKFEEIIPKEINRVDRIVEGLLSFARSPEPQLSYVNIEEVINSVLDDLKTTIESGNITIEKQFTPSPRINADKEQLFKAFSNIILNAIQSISGSGTVKVSVIPISESIQIKIIDSGQGISPENLKRIFDPFFTTKHYGTGLGLAITHSIIEAHKGTIEIESQLGVGTTVTVTLPAS